MQTPLVRTAVLVTRRLVKSFSDKRCKPILRGACRSQTAYVPSYSLRGETRWESSRKGQEYDVENTPQLRMLQQGPAE